MTTEWTPLIVGYMTGFVSALVLSGVALFVIAMNATALDDSGMED